MGELELGRTSEVVGVVVVGRAGRFHCTGSVISARIRGQNIISQAVFRVYWMPKWDLCALMTISGLSFVGMMRRVSR